MKKTILVFCFAISILYSNARLTVDTNFIETKITLKTNTGDIFGTLATPDKLSSYPLVLIIAGSGPTDRDGNNPMAKCEAYKKLAASLLKYNIASLRYDKRGIAESKAAGKIEDSLRFDGYIKDAEDWISLLKKDKRFTQIIVAGHSEGSLIGMIAAKKADKYISIAGAGQSADIILKEQLGTQPQMVKDIAFPILDSLKAGKLVKDANPMLASLFRPSIQPYMISWFKHDPQAEIKKLKVPTLIIQGTADIQVSVDDAKRLSAANPKAHLLIIEKMNHVLREIEGDREANIAAYNNAALPLDEELILSIVSFVIAK